MRFPEMRKRTATINTIAGINNKQKTCTPAPNPTATPAATPLAACSFSNEPHAIIKPRQKPRTPAMSVPTIPNAQRKHGIDAEKNRRQHSDHGTCEISPEPIDVKERDRREDRRRMSRGREDSPVRELAGEEQVIADAVSRIFDDDIFAPHSGRCRPCITSGRPITHLASGGCCAQTVFGLTQHHRRCDVIRLIDRVIKNMRRRDDAHDCDRTCQQRNERIGSMLPRNFNALPCQQEAICSRCGRALKPMLQSPPAMTDFSSIFHSPPTAQPSVRESLGVELPTIEICDVGARIEGVERYAGLVAQGIANVNGFEPDPQQFARVCKPRQRRNAGTSRFFSASAARRRFMSPDIPDARRFIQPIRASSIFSPRSAQASAVHGQINQHRPDDALDDVPEMPAIDYLKIDVQGMSWMCSWARAKRSHRR